MAFDSKRVARLGIRLIFAGYLVLPAGLALRLPSSGEPSTLQVLADSVVQWSFALTALGYLALSFAMPIRRQWILVAAGLEGLGALAALGSLGGAHLSDVSLSEVAWGFPLLSLGAVLLGVSEILQPAGGMRRSRLFGVAGACFVLGVVQLLYPSSKIALFIVLGLVVVQLGFLVGIFRIRTLLAASSDAPMVPTAQEANAGAALLAAAGIDLAVALILGTVQSIRWFEATHTTVLAANLLGGCISGALLARAWATCKGVPTSPARTALFAALAAALLAGISRVVPDAEPIELRGRPVSMAQATNPLSPPPSMGDERPSTPIAPDVPKAVEEPRKQEEPKREERKQEGPKLEDPKQEERKQEGPRRTADDSKLPLPTPPRDPAALAGTWKLVSSEVGGRRGDISKILYSRLVIRGKEFQMTSADGKSFGDSGPFVLLSGAQPPRIEVDIADVLTGGWKKTGIYRIDRDVLTICWGINPMRFASPPGSEFLLQEYRRVDR